MRKINKNQSKSTSPSIGALLGNTLMSYNPIEFPAG